MMVVPEETETALLEREALYFHSVFFKQDLPPEVVERYVAANRLCLPSIDESSRRRISTIVSRRLDVESVELVLRWRRLDTVLTRKIQILFYLVEVRSRYYDCFISQDTGLVHAASKLVEALLGTFWRFLKGMYLIRRHGLI